ncbi:hypothetical protein M3J09_006468 [Ascochyta lentis]
MHAACGLFNVRHREVELGGCLGVTVLGGFTEAEFCREYWRCGLFICCFWEWYRGECGWSLVKAACSFFNVCLNSEIKLGACRVWCTL